MKSRRWPQIREESINALLPVLIETIFLQEALQGQSGLNIKNLDSMEFFFGLCFSLCGSIFGYFRFVSLLPGRRPSLKTMPPPRTSSLPTQLQQPAERPLKENETVDAAFSKGLVWKSFQIYGQIVEDFAGEKQTYLQAEIFHRKSRATFTGSCALRR